MWAVKPHVPLSVIVLIAAAVLAGCGGGEARPPEAFAPSWSPDGRTIAYVVDPDPAEGCSYGSCVYRFELWVMRADGTGAKKLALGIIGGHPPTWSPDGRTIAFAHDTLEDGGELYTVRKDGAHMRRLTRTPWVDDTPAAWSPDGKRLLFVHWPLESASTQLYVTNADGSRQRRLTSLEPYEASWSPDGSRIAVTTFDGLFAVGADGRGQKMLFRVARFGMGGIGWSADSRQIAFGVEGGFAVVDVDGRVLARPSERGYRWDWNYEMDASWSPDRTTLAYARPEGGIDLITENGASWKRLTTTGAGPTWSPDGRRVAFTDDGDIVVVNADGTGRVNLTAVVATDALEHPRSLGSSPPGP